MDFRLRRCGADDATAVSLIGQATILETYAGLAEGSDLYAYVTKDLGVERFHALLADELVTAWLLEADVGKSAVGYALLLPGKGVNAETEMELERFYLLYRFHGLGLGKRMMDAVLEHARSTQAKTLSLRVNSQNARAIGFYIKYGFTTVAEEPFRAGERDYRVLVMHLAL